MWYSPGGTRQQFVLEEAQAYSQPLSGLGVVGTSKHRRGFTHYVPPPPPDKYGIPKGLSLTEAKEYAIKMATQRQQDRLAQNAKSIPEVQAQALAMEQARLARQAAMRAQPVSGVKHYTSPIDEARRKAELRMSMTREAQAARQQAALQAAYPPEPVVDERLVAQSSDGYAPQDGGSYAAQQVAQEAEAARRAFYGESYLGAFGDAAADAQVAQGYKDYQNGIAQCQQIPEESQQVDCIRQWEEYKKQLDDYQKQLDAYNQQVSQAQQTQAVQPQAVAESRSLDTGSWQLGPRVSAQQKTLYEAQQQHGQPASAETWMQKVQRTFQEQKIWSAGSGIGQREVDVRRANQKALKDAAKVAARERAEARAWGADAAQKMKDQRILAKAQAEQDRQDKEAAVRKQQEENQKSPQQPKEVPPTQEELRTSQLTKAFAADAARRAALAQQKADEAESYKRRVAQANKPVTPTPSAKQYFGVPYRPLVHQPVENKWAAGQQPFGPGGMMLVKGGGRPATPSLPDFSTPGVSASYGKPKQKGFSQDDLEEAVFWGF